MTDRMNTPRKSLGEMTDKELIENAKWSVTGVLMTELALIDKRMILIEIRDYIDARLKVLDEALTTPMGD